MVTMMNKKIIAGVILFLVVGIVSVVAMGQEPYGHPYADKSAWLEKMGLPADATHEQIIDAKKDMWHHGFREKFADDATYEQIMEAKALWREHHMDKVGLQEAWHKGGCGLK